MKITKTSIKDLLIIEPTVYHDDRGSFYESFHQEKTKDWLPNRPFVQENISISKKHVLRGLHLQAPPYSQAKLVSVLSGSVIDVVVDLRKASETYGKHFSLVLSAKNKKQLYVPRGFAHGFISLEDNSLFSYKCDNFYHKSSEISILWNDPQLAIHWNVDRPILSKKDIESSVLWKDFNSPF